jgi:uncharacterized NAD(P)/FAD-binding protein YdhS
MADRRAPVAIVGAGFSGTMAAANLARRGIRSILIEANGRAGQGAAYSTREPAHLLNIRAQNMGAWADEPGHFAASEGVEGGSYAERRQFGRYLRSILEHAIASGHVDLVEARAVAADRASGYWRVRLQDGETIESDALVLATGNQAPAPLAGTEAGRDRLIDDPWSERARAAIGDAARRGLDVLILGTSLTMVDVVLSLDSAGFGGRILALSRRGKIPLGNGIDEPAPVEWQDAPAAKVREIAKWLRRRSVEVGFRPAVDSLRPHSSRLWQNFPVSEKRLFLRYGRPWWDIHRHRIAPQVARRVDELIAGGQLKIVAGRLIDARVAGEAIEVTYRKRGRDDPEPPQKFGYVFNCTGPLGDIGRTQEPLLRQMMEEGLAQPDELAIGLAVDERSRAGPAERFWALGTLTKGRHWEIIAVPDIRDQAAAVAQDIATELSR